jgi:hypothetical protein
MIWGIPFLRNGLNVSYAEAVNCVSMVPLGWVIGCPLLGYLSDRLGRRKPVLIAGALLMLASGAGIYYLPAGVAPPYVLGLLLGIGSGAAMLPYTMIKEVNTDNVKGACDVHARDRTGRTRERVRLYIQASIQGCTSKSVGRRHPIGVRFSSVRRVRDTVYCSRDGTPSNSSAPGMRQ